MLNDNLKRKIWKDNFVSILEKYRWPQRIPLISEKEKYKEIEEDKQSAWNVPMSLRNKLLTKSYRRISNHHDTVFSICLNHKILSRFGHHSIATWIVCTSPDDERVSIQVHKHFLTSRTIISRYRINTSSTMLTYFHKNHKLLKNAYAFENNQWRMFFFFFFF